MSTKSAEATGVLQIAVKRMVRAYPFHVHLLSMGRLEEEPGLETMAVTVRDEHIVFLFDARFVLAHSLEEIVGVLHHEVLHVVFGHLFADPERYPNRIARVIAEEVTVNEFVPEPLPGTPILLKNFPQLPPLEDTDRRYQRLAATRQPPGPVPLGGQEVWPVPLDDHRVWEEARGGGRVAEAVVMSAVGRAAGMLTPEEIGRMPAELLEAITQAARGTAAGREIEELAASRTATVSWKTVLRRFVSRAASPVPSYLRPPRRFPHLVGIVPGSTRRMEKARVMAVIDTSGSMTRDLLEQIGAELRNMVRSHEIVVVECDSEIQRIYPFEDALGEVKGRGGTDLRPPFERPVLAKIRPDVVVYFTDGEGPAHNAAPRVPVLWCLTPGAKSPASWGTTVWMA
jgi:predicted metal-dependent peptidase